MTIVTRFDVGDAIWFSHKNEVQSQIIKRVQCQTLATSEASPHVSIHYVVDKNTVHHENFCFATEEELRASLADEKWVPKKPKKPIILKIGKKD